MITKRRLVSTAFEGDLAAVVPGAIRMASTKTASRMLVGFGAGNAIDVIMRILVEGRGDAFKTALAKLSVEPAGETPKEFAQLIRSDFDHWGPIIQASGLTPAD